MSQRELGIAAGLKPASADVRIAQYESGSRNPKSRLLSALARALGVSVAALTVPDMSGDAALMQTLFALEDTRGLEVFNADGEVCIRFGGDASVSELVADWQCMADMVRDGTITREEYDGWRYGFN